MFFCNFWDKKKNKINLGDKKKKPKKNPKCISSYLTLREIAAKTASPLKHMFLPAVGKIITVYLLNDATRRATVRSPNTEKQLQYGGSLHGG